MITARVAAASAAAVLAAACTLGPDPTAPPPAPVDEASRYVNATTTRPVSSGAWWEHLGDPVTDELVRTALEQNTDVTAAAAAVLQAEAALAAARGAELPEAGLSLSATRQKTSFVLPGTGRIGIFSTTFSEELSVSYQVDLFGRLARTRQAAWAELLASEADARAVADAVAAQVVRARVTIATLQRRLELALETAASWRSTARTVEDRYRTGVADAGELYLTRQSRAAAEAAVPQTRRELAAARHALDVLLGHRPGTGEEPARTLPPVPDIGEIPVGVPAGLLDRRPDLIAARMRFAAASARVGVALANLYPSLSLTGSAGVRSDGLAGLTSSEELVYNAVAGVVAPLFSGGRRRADVTAARARAEQLALVYSGAVLTALREVEDALVASATLREQLESTTTQYDSAVAAAALARERYHAGAGRILDLFVADRARATAESALLAVRAELWNARVALYLALGGEVPDRETAGQRRETPEDA